MTSISHTIRIYPDQWRCNELKRRNTIVICSDEHHFHYAGYAGHPFVHTPNLDQLAMDGCVFDRCYCNCPVCTPSRMSFITGKYVHQIGSWFIGVPLSEKESTWPRTLSQNGIHTSMIGKMDFCGPYQSGGFDDYQIIERRGVFRPYPRTSPLGSRTLNYYRPDKIAHVKHAGIRRPLVTDGSNGHNDELGFFDHDRIVTQWALEYLDQHQNDKTPWTLYIGYLMPHWPYLCPREFFDMYYPDQIDMPFDCVMPENSHLHPAVREFQRACGLSGITEDDIRRVLAAYCGMITAMDSMIGQIFSKLHELGIYDSVNIIYTSDHGDSCFEHGLLYKQCAYDGSCAVPLIVRIPGEKQGQRVSTPVSLVDLYPSVLDLYGIKADETHPGKSWIPLLHENTPQKRDYVFAEYHGNFFRNDWYMLIRNNYKYVYYVNGKPSLFDLSVNPHETNDLSENEQYQPLLASFEALLRSIVDPEAVSLRSKHDLGLIGPDGEDYTQTLSFDELNQGYETGRFAREPEFPAYTSEDCHNEH